MTYGITCLCDHRTDIKCNESHCDIASPGAPGDPNQCRICWKRLGYPGLVQIVCTADGIGDALLGLTTVTGLKHDRPNTNIQYVLSGTKQEGASWQTPWVQLFNEGINSTTSLMKGCESYYPHKTYKEQNDTRLIQPRWEHYSATCGTKSTLPTPLPLPTDDILWAEQYKSCVVLSPFSEWECRIWLLSHWLHLERLLTDAGHKCVIIDGRTPNTNRTQYFRSPVLRDESATRIASLMLAADCYVGQDNGMSHLAGLLTVPSVVLSAQIKGEKIFGLYPTVQIINGPLPCGGCHWQQAHGWAPHCDKLCANLQSIKPEVVFEYTLAQINKGHTLLDDKRINTLQNSAIKCSKLDGDYAELGVYRGGSAKIIATNAPNKTVHLFDTFTGLPDSDKNGPHRQGEFTTSEQEVKNYLSSLNNVKFHTGIFPSTTNDLQDTQYAFVHIDADLYESTRDALIYFWPRMVPDGVIILDDYLYHRCPGVSRAISEVLPNIPIERTSTYQARIIKGRQSLSDTTQKHVIQIQPQNRKQPCTYFGSDTGERVKCPTCRGNIELKTFNCVKHGKCTPQTKAPDIACCITCQDYTPIPTLPLKEN